MATRGPYFQTFGPKRVPTDSPEKGNSKNIKSFQNVQKNFNNPVNKVKNTFWPIWQAWTLIFQKIRVDSESSGQEQLFKPMSQEYIFNFSIKIFQNRSTVPYFIILLITATRGPYFHILGFIQIAQRRAIPKILKVFKMSKKNLTTL